METIPCNQIWIIGLQSCLETDVERVVNSHVCGHGCPCSQLIDQLFEAEEEAVIHVVHALVYLQSPKPSRNRMAER